MKASVDPRLIDPTIIKIFQKGNMSHFFVIDMWLNLTHGKILYSENTDHVDSMYI